MIRQSRLVLVATWLLLGALPASAEQFKSIDGHEVHYVVFPTAFLQPDIASRYGIRRGGGRHLINISVLNPQRQAQAATVTGRARNLLGQSQSLKFREVKEQEAIYYLAEIRSSSEERFRFDLVIAPSSGGKALELQFEQVLYADD